VRLLPDVTVYTWRHSSYCAQCATDTRLRTTWLMVSELTGLKSCWLFFLEYHAREGVPDIHSEYRWVETSASSGVGRAGPQTYRCSYRTAATPSQCVWLVCESSGDILTNICVEFTCSSLCYLFNSWPMKYLTRNFITRWFRVFYVVLQQILCILCMIRFQFVLLQHK